MPTPRVLLAMAAVEAAHFRTVTDTGSNEKAMTVWSAFRREMGLAPLTIEDLPVWDGTKYVKPANSRLIVFEPDEAVHEKLLAASPAYRTTHTRQVPVTVPQIAEAIAQGVAQQCNAWAPHLFDRVKFPYPPQALLEEVIAKLQSRV